MCLKYNFMNGMIVDWNNVQLCVCAHGCVCVCVYVRVRMCTVYVGWPLAGNQMSWALESE